MTIGERLAARLGGTWTYNNASAWVCDDGRVVFGVKLEDGVIHYTLRDKGRSWDADPYVRPAGKLMGTGG